VGWDGQRTATGTDRTARDFDLRFVPGCGGYWGGTLPGAKRHRCCSEHRQLDYRQYVGIVSAGMLPARPTFLRCPVGSVGRSDHGRRLLVEHHTGLALVGTPGYIGHRRGGSAYRPALAPPPNTNRMTVSDDPAIIPTHAASQLPGSVPDGGPPAHSARTHRRYGAETLDVPRRTTGGTEPNQKEVRIARYGSFANGRPTGCLRSSR
jgi:hypothetical protein